MLYIIHQFNTQYTRYDEVKNKQSHMHAHTLFYIYLFDC